MSLSRKVVLRTFKGYVTKDEVDSRESRSGAILTALGGECGRFPLAIDYHETPRQAMFHIPNYLRGHDTSSPEIQKALLHCNYRFSWAKFSMDGADGEVCLDVALTVGDIIPSHEQFKRAMRNLMAAVDLSYPILQRVLVTPGMTAKESFRIFEGGLPGKDKTAEAGPQAARRDPVRPGKPAGK